ncbi:MAG: TadE/TadG family type IV pilus assembly protein, partial [Egicoccus sp.]
PPPPPPARRVGQHGSLSLEAVLVLPVVALLAIGLLDTVTVLRDVLLLHEAARVGARVAATTTDNGAVANAARDAVPELAGVRLAVTPEHRAPGDVLTVTAAVSRRVGPTSLSLSATAHARVEPSVGAGGAQTWPPPGASRNGPLRPWRSDGWASLVEDGPTAPPDTGDGP